MTTITLTQYEILTTGSDGGHRYISSTINHGGQQRNLTVLFENKSDEQKLAVDQAITVKGNLIDEGAEQSLMLLNSKLV